MPVNLMEIPARVAGGGFHVLIESPRGSRIKFKYEPRLGAVMYARPLALGVHYPFDWGFIPGTCAPDGDPVDAMVIFDEATYPGIVIACRALGVIRLQQNRKNKPGRERNDRVIAVPLNAPRFEHLQKPSDLPARWRKELEQFFLSATFLEAKNPKILRWDDGAAAERLIQASIEGAR